MAGTDPVCPVGRKGRCVMTLTPAYGRDYKSAKAAKADFHAGKDFIIADFFHPYDGKPCNKEQLGSGDYPVRIRYKKLAQVCVVDRK